MPENLENSEVTTGQETFCFHSNPKEGNTDVCAKCHSVVLISHASTILQARLQHYVYRELSDIQAGFRKGRRTRDQISSICWITEKVREYQEKTSTSSSSTTWKPLTVCITRKCGKFLKKQQYQNILPVSSEICMQDKQQQLELHMQQCIFFKIRKEYFKGFPDSWTGKESSCNEGDRGSIPEFGLFSGEGIGYPLQYSWVSLVAQLVKESTYNAGDPDSIPGLGRSPGEGKSYPLQYSGLENPMGFSPWGCKELDTSEWLSLFLYS